MSAVLEQGLLELTQRPPHLLSFQQEQEDVEVRETPLRVSPVFSRG